MVAGDKTTERERSFELHRRNNVIPIAIKEPHHCILASLNACVTIYIVSDLVPYHNKWHDTNDVPSSQLINSNTGIQASIYIYTIV